MKTEAEWLAWGIADAEARLQVAVRSDRRKEAEHQRERLAALERAAKRLLAVAPKR